MSIPLGQKTKTIDDKFQLISICIFDLDKAAQRRISINYELSGEIKTLDLKADEWNAFFARLNLGKEIINLFKQKEDALTNLEISQETIDAQFLNG